MKTANISKTDLEGITAITSTDWDGKILQLSRASFLRHKDHKYLDLPGIYIIYSDHFDKQENGSEIYIGQGDDIRQRLNSHASQKPFWNKVLIFTSEKMNIALAYNIEKEFILLAKEAGRYTVTNGDCGQSKKIGSKDKEYVEEFIKNSKSILNLTTIDVFQLNADGVFIYEKLKHIAKIKIHNEDPGKVILLKGSKLPIVLCQESEIATSHPTSIKINGKTLEVTENTDIEIDNGILPSIVSRNFRLSEFKNNCGIGADKVIRKRQPTSTATTAEQPVHTCE